MSTVNRNSIKVAVIDMNNGQANQGMRGIQEILVRYREDHGTDLSYELFDLRQKGEIPDLKYDIFIASGGPGSPYDGEGSQWENDFFALLTDIESFNAANENAKKYAFLICHSYQLACRKFKVGQVIPRRSTAFGIFPVYLLEGGRDEPVFDGLPNPFYSVDSRDWQVVNPDDIPVSNPYATVLALEKVRPHVDLERCVMAVRFTDEIIGTQFHPEADPLGMKMYLLQEEKKKSIVENHGLDKYLQMLERVDDPDKLPLTQSVILPNFITQAVNTLQEHVS